MKIIRLLALLLPVLSSCVLEEIPEQTVSLSFEIDATKSSVLAGESDIVTFTVYAYSSGLLETSATWTSGASPASLRLVAGRCYDLYAIANVEAPALPLDESGLASYSCGITRELGIPMAWSSAGRVFFNSETVYMDFTRLAAKLELSLDKMALKGARIKSVNLRQTMKTCLAFGSGVKALRRSDVGDGDSASEEDLRALNSGGSISLYALENCQGVLLPGNKDSWRKVPPEECRELCTCLEIDCEFLDGSPVQGEAVYRIFPGKDELSDFSLLRNSVVSIGLKLTDIGLDMAINLVENNTAYRSGLADYCLSEGLHDIDDMYVGEILKFRICLSDELLSFWSEGRLSESCIVFGFEDDRGVHAIEDCIEISYPFYEDGNWYFTANVKNIIPVHNSCAFYLYDDVGVKLVSRMNSLSAPERELYIRTAHLAIAELDEDGRCLDTPSVFLPSLDMVVNGATKRLGLYLMDDDGNLFPNGSPNLFNPEIYAPLDVSFVSDTYLLDNFSEAYRSAILSCCSSRLIHRLGESQRPYYEVECKISNDGRNTYANKGLSLALMRDDAVVMQISAGGYSTSGLEVRLDAIPWKAWILGEYTDCGFELNPSPGNRTQVALYNPSRLDLDLSLGQFLHSNLVAKGNEYYFVDNKSSLRHAFMSRIDRTLEAYLSPSLRGESLSCYSARLDSYDVDVYRAQYSRSYYGDFTALYENYRFVYFPDYEYLHGMDGEDCGTFTELSLSSLGGYTVPGSTFCDLTDSPGSAPEQAALRYSGLTVWENGERTCSARIDPLGTPGQGEAKKIVTEQGVSFEFSFDDESGAIWCRIGDDGDYYGMFSISFRPVYYVYLCYTPDGGGNYFYQKNDHSFSPFPELYRISGMTDSRLTSRASYSAGTGSYGRAAVLTPMEKEMALINRSYCMASSSRESYYDTQTTGRSHRWATMAVPQRIELEISICSNSPHWTPVRLTLDATDFVLRNHTFYDRTSEGYFAEYAVSGPYNYVYAGRNPDGSPQTNGAEGMPVTHHCILPEITSSATASNVIPVSECKVELAFSDGGVSRVSYR